MKTAISIPDPLFAAADELARRLGLSRSELYQRAIASYLERHDDAMVTDRLDRVYGGDDRGTLDPVLDQLQRRSLPKDEW
jgi:predicted transcriptional regulator